MHGAKVKKIPYKDFFQIKFRVRVRSIPEVKRMHFGTEEYLEVSKVVHLLYSAFY
jgi:hypothetical protein